MRPSIPILLLLAGLSTNVLAQGNNNNNNGGSSVTNPPANTNTNPPAQNTNQPAPSQSNPPAASNTNNEKSSQTNPPDNNPGSSKTEDNKPAQTTNNPPPASQTEQAPDLNTSSTTSPNAVVVTGAAATGTGNGDDPPPPKYTPPANGRYTVPDYPAPAVPNTKNAPYMQRSDLPEGTVFIAVGAALGLIGLIAFAWRMVVAWQLRRSIRRANMVAVDSKAGLLGRYVAPSTTKKSFYSAGAGSSLSLDHLGSSRTGLGPTPNTSLFFSPTANNSSPVHQNRGSQYLPAGYYAPAASSNLNFNASRDSLPRPRPATRDSHVATPPASPLLTPTARRPSPGQGHAQAPSISSTLGVQPGGRTPSTYLEDMLDIPFPEEPGMTADQARRSSRRRSSHSHQGGHQGSHQGGSGSRR
ncbi:hypothetical protein H072_6858 [Dactylellina haptotyla CBS 200.50]|uniref:Uncharacterized protein n=1 Tax=Dactylellina haptotyla (strain CBS 200.50) TaxID=1284197 RepID=S8A933_DACHA|nr:hypothetical protein H072_6858 [Dactylellina haptotyla CBS 200.50]